MLARAAVAAGVDGLFLECRASRSEATCQERCGLLVMDLKDVEGLLEAVHGDREAAKDMVRIALLAIVKNAALCNVMQRFWGFALTRHICN